MRADAVMVLGKELRRDRERGLRELRARSAAAAVALRETSARVVINLEAPLRGQDAAGSEIVSGMLDALGVPRGRRLLERSTRSTREEALGAARLAAERGFTRVLAITSAYHVPRARRQFIDVLGGHDRVCVHTPEAFLRGASALEREWILDGAAEGPAFDHERRVEATLSLLARVIGPLPDRLRWGLEVRAGAMLRGLDDRRGGT